MLKHYKAYFERVAIASPDIAHMEEDPSYFYIADKYNPKAFDDALKNVTGERPILLLERYVSDADDNANRNRFLHVQGRFTIVCSSEVGNRQSIEEAQYLSETVALKVLAKMAADFEVYGTINVDGQLQKVFYNEEKIPMDPVGPMFQKYYGITVGFEWRCPLMVKHIAGDWQEQNQGN